MCVVSSMRAKEGFYPRAPHLGAGDCCIGAVVCNIRKESIVVVNGLYSFLYLFYTTFGITPPKKGEEARALFWLIVISIGSLAFVAAMLFMVYKIMV
jgi:hypothetical protein